jgi:predicted dithiol-disulfide oxidoreductase (DUF899 family)
MFGPDYEGGCPSCSSTADSFNGILAHLKACDVTMICVSRPPIDKLLGVSGANGLEYCQRRLTQWTYTAAEHQYRSTAR